MVLYFLPRGHEESGHFIFMGRDKVENEDLIAYGLAEDVWFHVDKLSSAHVYMRVQRGQTLADLSKEELEDCCQLVKANSIQGNKESSAVIVYTPWANLRKTSNMEVGQVGFVSDKAVSRYNVSKRCNETVNRLNKTRQERFPDLAAEREAYEAAGRAEKKAEERARRKSELETQREREREQQERSYDRIMGEEKMTSNREAAEKYTSVEEAEEDFM